MRSVPFSEFGAASGAIENRLPHKGRDIPDGRDVALSSGDSEIDELPREDSEKAGGAGRENRLFVGGQEGGDGLLLVRISSEELDTESISSERE